MRDLQLSSIHVPSIDESLNNPLQFLHLILSALYTDIQNQYPYIMCGSVKDVWQEI